MIGEKSKVEKFASSMEPLHTAQAHMCFIDRYRDIWRYSRLFVWKDDSGQAWYVDLGQYVDLGL